MEGRIVNIGEDLTTVVTQDQKILEFNSLFIPIKLVPGDFVEIENNKIVIK
jgi:hypothetical protein